MNFGRMYWPNGRLRGPWCAGLISSDMLDSNRRLVSTHQFSKNPISISINGYGVTSHRDDFLPEAAQPALSWSHDYCT
jgi:hypothetical protein